MNIDIQSEIEENKFWLKIWSGIAITSIIIILIICLYNYFINILLIDKGYKRVETPVSYKTIWIKSK